MRRHLWEAIKGAISQNKTPVSETTSEAMSHSIAVFGFLLVDDYERGHQGNGHLRRDGVGLVQK